MDQQTFDNQLEQTYKAFRAAPKTMMQVSVETGIMRASICRYVAHLRKRNKVHALKKKICPITKHKATFYTCDPDLIPEPGQQNLFKSERCRV